ncbi:MAG: DNA mismatch repair protein MutS [Desulfobacterales bacterium]|jgi:DNA mismatch repair protein MutS|nr:DNA mismatch repair protein MutS [Desulfobacter sp.]MDP6681975.1 DNA mismatch repair protein MutS [Desulfobacterales bacterium]MDP6808249.1 DNA mismatch repair protein MutS [Desulfobacterales bacterium]|tara:strand:- start:8696 stop:11332 length:2637 start_codon:yes stop_codon:yes gene_type:complete
MTPPKTTPMIKQYLSIKDNYPDAILLFRMGDFYEMFFEDAELASKLLEITLTSRNKREPSPVPMCGVPAKAVQNYIRRLIDQGYKVAICDQIEAPSMAKGLVKRDVVRVITPGMIIENEFLDEKTNNYVLALALNNDTIGLSYLDISTGTFRVSESRNLTAILDETLRVSPNEVLLPKSSGHEEGTPFFRSIRSAFQETSVTFLEDKVFDYKNGHDILIDQFNSLSLKGFGCEHLKAGIGAAGALISYVEETQKNKLAHLTGIETYSLDNFLMVDDLSCRNLELMKNLLTGSRAGTFLGLMDRTVTAMGGRLLKRWIRYPLLDENEIKCRLDAVGEAKAHIQVARNIREALKHVYDLERIRGKITMGHANARDLVALKQSVRRLPEIWSALLQFESTLFQSDEDLDPLYSLAKLIEDGIDEDPPLTIHEGGIIKTGFNRELDEQIRIGQDGKSWLAHLETKEKDATGIKALKVRYNKVFGYYIEIPKTHSDVVPPHYIRKQTLVHAERYIVDELKSFEIRVLNAQDRRAALEYEIFNEIKEEVIRNNQVIQRVAAFLAQLDCLLNLSEIADRNDYSRPEINRDGRISIEDGRHPVVEKMITGERFVPNSVEMDDHDSQVLIITGPNMAGKSTVLRQVALQVLMAQMGSFIPAKKGSITLTDRIFTRVGALDNLSQGQSTFMVEMEETANILNSATKSSLVIMDEIGRGTSTYDGFSIAWAVAEYLHDLKNEGVKTLFATHYHELTDLAKTKSRVKNYNIAVKEWNDEIIFLRKLVKGATNRSYGIQVARLAGIPDGVINRAKKILFEIENEGVKKTVADIDSSDDKELKPGHVQLNLFNHSGNLVIQKLKTLDISKMTPLQALNYLDKLREKALETDD